MDTLSRVHAVRSRIPTQGTARKIIGNKLSALPTATYENTTERNEK